MAATVVSGAKIAGFRWPFVDGRPCTGNVFFVDSGHARASDSPAVGGHGRDPAKPFATIDYAVGQCTANNGDYIYVCPGHAETLAAAAAIDADVAGITIVGIGNGETRPIITMGTTTTVDIDIDAADVYIENIVFKPALDAIVAMIDVNADDFTMKNCEFRDHASYQAVTYIDINGGAANGCDRAKIINTKILATNDGATNGIELGEVADGVEIVGCYIDGDFSNAGIHNPTGKVLTNLLIKDCIVANRETGDHAIELVSACTGFAIDNRMYGDTLGTIFDPGSLKCLGNLEVDAIDESGVGSPRTAAGGFPDDSITNATIADDTILGQDNNNNAFASTSVVANEDGSIIERLEQVQEAVNNGTGSAMATNKSVVDALGTNGTTVTDSAVSVLGAIGADNANNAFASTSIAANEDGSVLERLEQVQEAVNKGSGTALGTNRSIIDEIKGSALNYNGTNYLAVVATFATSTWNSSASHEIVTVTGVVRVRVLAQVVNDVTGGGTIKLGTSVTDWIAATTQTALDAGEIWTSSTIASNIFCPTFSGAVIDRIVSTHDIGYTNATSGTNSGQITFHIWWEPLSSTGAIAAGAGGTL